MTRQTHHRVRDHFGRELASIVVIDPAIGRYPVRTPVQDVLADLYARLEALETSNHVLGTFTLDAVILAPGSMAGTAGTPIGAFHLDAVTLASMPGSFTLDAEIIVGGRFTLDAWINVPHTFTLDAWIV